MLKGNKKYIIGLILLSGMISYFSLQIAVYVSYAIDGILFKNGEQIPEYLKGLLALPFMESLLILSGIIIAINAIVAFFSYIRERITTKFTLTISANLKEKLYSHILKLEYKEYQSYSKVEMLQRANEDAAEYANFYKVQFNLILDILSLTFFIVTQGMFLSTSITIYLVVTVIIMLLFAFWYYRKMTAMLEKVITKKKKLLGAVINNVNQFKFIRIYNRQKEEIQKYEKLNKDYTKEDIKFVKFILFFEIISEHITYLSDPVICLLGGISIIRGEMTLRYSNSPIVICHKNTKHPILIWRKLRNHRYLSSSKTKD